MRNTRSFPILFIALASMLLSACNLMPQTVPPETAAKTGTAIKQAQPAEKKATTAHIPALTKTGNYQVIGDANFPAYWSGFDAGSNVLANTKPTDLWQRIRDGFSLDDKNHRRIQQQLDWYVRHPAYMRRVAERARPYLYYIVETLEKHHIPSEIALLPIVESAFKPFAYSHGRASGIWQFIPSTGRRYGLKQNWWYDGRRDVYAATRSAARLLDNLQKQFNGDWLLALAAYNSGEGTIHRAIRRNRRKGKPTDFWSLKLPPETSAYVPKLLALKKYIQNPATYNLDMPVIANAPYFERIKIDQQLDLAKAAELAGIKLDKLYQLNPAYNRWATSPNGSSYLLLPRDKAEIFRQKLAKLPNNAHIRWLRHKIRPGETLSSISHKYHTSIQTIKQANHLRSSRLRTGHSLTIPVASRRPQSYRLSANQRKSALQNILRKGLKLTHIVRRGDTFWDLASRHKVSVRKLASWNGMAPRDPLVPGQKLVIWSHTGKVASNNNLRTSFIPPRSRKITQRIGYRVRPGDSLARISQKFRVSVAQLCRWNRISKHKYLQPGQRLTLYVDVTRQSG
ncbi:Membrane-bound lytic murein transglycosylase D [hydrothermal vent metagenome]|uniref:Membrane-bound lytic murein transglycosylase D n=1 Tax=hydrothermal vent metagenome TaxID=652676 RepID=A0A3B1B3C3_9ZZZZ